MLIFPFFLSEKGLISNIPRNIKPRRFLKEKKAKTFGTCLVERQTLRHFLEVCIVVQFCVFSHLKQFLRESYNGFPKGQETVREKNSSRSVKSRGIEF